MPLNSERAERVAHILVANAPYNERGLRDRERVTDLLTDLHHYCTIHGLDFEDINYVAEQHFHAEGREDG